MPNADQSAVNAGQNAAQEKAGEAAATGAQDAGTTAAGTDSDDTLGDAGKKALEAERAARKAAEKQARELAAKIKAAEDAGKTEAEKQADAIANVKAELAKMKAENARMKIAAETGVPTEFLTGPGDDPEAFAKAIKEWGEKQAKAGAATSTDGAQGTGVVQHMGNPAGSGTTSLAAQIAAAEKAGDRTLIASLKAQMLGG